MKGLELSRAYYEEIGQPMLKELFPGLYPRVAAGLAGEGSECYGWDDELSRDHDFGPGFCIWLSDEDYLKYGKDLQRAYDALPKDFGGFPARNTSGRGDGRVGVMPLRAFYARYIGEEQPPRSNLRWFMMQDEFLSSATNGEVFYDGAGEFTRVRDALLAYYPEDVRIKKIVACAGKMAQAGQYNYLRCVKRREYVAAQFALSEFMSFASRMVYLLNKVYRPYYKWCHRGMKDFRLVPEAYGLFDRLALSDAADVNGRTALIEELCSLVLKELQAQGLTDLSDDFLEAHLDTMMRRISDPQIRYMHVLQY
ncbi:MAG: DUF4037 domain-containing protein [Firmicutes bacterium]|nr:DUF4037 domain-containing protein [Bacillota bacterium]